MHAVNDGQSLQKLEKLRGAESLSFSATVADTDLAEQFSGHYLVTEFANCTKHLEL